ncbi:MAG: acetyl esterase/lipase, partial [Saprospiraceae bacterium]
MRNCFFTLFLLLFSIAIFSQEIKAPEQPSEGPGGQDYLHEEVVQYDYAQNPDGFWLYEPAAPKPEKANVIVFIHGYGAYNPMIYGKWIKHLVRKGNTVIFPRYQRNLLSPSPKHFAENVVEAIHNALDTLNASGHVKPVIDHFSLVGHSYGGVISANLCVYYKRYTIPKPKAVLLVSPGTGPFSGGLLKTYEDIPEGTNLLVMVSDRDHTVGDKIGKLIYSTAVNVKNRNLIRQYSDHYGSESLTAGHDESYSVDQDFDSGIKNF